MRRVCRPSTATILGVFTRDPMAVARPALAMADVAGARGAPRHILRAVLGRVVSVVPLVVLSFSAAVLGIASCAEANLPPEESETPLPDREAPNETDAATNPADTSTPDVQLDDAPQGDGSSALRVFVTSTTTNARFGGQAGGDARCKALADAASLGGTWMAWLSNKNGPHAVDRLTSAGPWHLVTGEMVAATKAELVSGTLRKAIDRDEKGAAVVGNGVWTGTGPDGKYLTNDCDQWTTGNDGRSGTADSTSATWTSAAVDDCDQLRHLYCFEL